MYEYEISESELIKRANRFILPFLLLGMPGMVVFLLIIFKVNILNALLIWIVSFLYCWLVVTLNNLRFVKKSQRILIDDNKIELQSHKKKDILLWRSIIKVKVSENKSEIPYKIKLYGDNKKVLEIYGFKEMLNISDLIKEKLTNKIVQIKKERLNYSSSYVGACIVWSVLYVVFLFVYLVIRYVF